MYGIETIMNKIWQNCDNETTGKHVNIKIQ
jgi:hypothetical protein